MSTDTAPNTDLDVDAYVARVGYSGELAPTLPVLQGLHLAHATTIPFENLDILLGRPVRLDLESLQAKLVAARRGGYCFEQNTLFAAVLERAGFAVTRLAARVRFGAQRITPRTHMLLRVDLGSQAGPWLADVGFGGHSLLHPIPLSPGAEAHQFGRTYRLSEEPLHGLLTLQARLGESWNDLYAFTLEPQFPVDYVVANHYTSTHPESRFVNHMLVTAVTTEAVTTLFDRELVVRRGEEVSRRIVEDDELLRVLEESFGLPFPPGTRFRTPASGT